jgi:hypothetical protein
LWGLSTAPAFFKTNIAKLTQHGISESCPCGCCVLCSSTLSSPSVLVADAGQAYEMPEVRLIASSVDALFESADKLNVPPAIFVTKGQRSQVGFGGSHKNTYHDRFIYYRYTLHRALLGCLLLRMFVCGPLVLLQNFGIPTGGPHSTVLLSILLGRLEDLFIRFKWKRIMEAVGLNLPLSSVMLAVRYADDYGAVSRSMCRPCLVKILNKVYGQVLKFKIDLDFVVAGPSISFSYLDLVVFVGFDWLRLGHNNRNEMYILSGVSVHKKKNRFRPYITNYSKSVFAG